MRSTNNSFQTLFETQKANQYNIGNSTYNQRIKTLNRLKRAIAIDYRDAIKEALKKI